MQHQSTSSDGPSSAGMPRAAEPTKLFRPRAARDGTVQIPTAWAVLAQSIVSSEDAALSAKCAVALAQQVMSDSRFNRAMGEIVGARPVPLHDRYELNREAFVSDSLARLGQA